MREWRAAVKKRRDRKLELRAAAQGDETLFAPSVADAFAKLVTVELMVHADVVLPSLDNLLPSGRKVLWSGVEGGRLAPVGYHSGSAAIDFVV